MILVSPQTEILVARDCDTLTPNARKIFEKLQPFYHSDPWGKSQWEADGRVYDNGWYDLRKSADRQRLIEWKKNLIGYFVGLRASIYRDENGSLEGFEMERYSGFIKRNAEHLLILEDLDFQIETMDFIELT